MIQYLDFADRVADVQYRQLLECILNQGEEVDTQQETAARKVIGYTFRFPLENGFPMITERDLLTSGKKTPSIFHQAIAELCAFLNGARSQQELEQLGCYWWKDWVTPEKCAKRGLLTGDLGPGSYGPAWRAFPTEDGPFDQIRHILEQIEELPHLRTHFVSPWIPQYIGRGKHKQQKVVVAPCHGWFHVHINTRTKELSLFCLQRSVDVPVGLVANLIQYGALTLMLAQVTGYQAKNLIYTLDDAHIYDGQLTSVERLLKTQPQPLPTMTLEASVKSLFAFRSEHFNVTDYLPQLERMRIWTPI